MLEPAHIERAAARYLPAGRFAHGFARGKMKGDPAYAAVLRHLPESGCLVDVGCGEGHLLALAHELRGGLRLFGVDHDHERVERGRQALGDAATLTVGDARVCELPRAHAIACLDVLHYLPEPEQDAVIQRLVDHLEPGGVLLIRDGASQDGLRSWVTTLSEKLAVATGRHKGDGVFFRPSEALRASMEACGLTVEEAPCADGTPFANRLYLGHAS
jgi:2-polyprenyl-3-methyl-5-hydroxy-6-metoxy-1,4-benzoquinol methylase